MVFKVLKDSIEQQKRFLKKRHTKVDNLPSVVVVGLTVDMPSVFTLNAELPVLEETYRKVNITK